MIRCWLGLHGWCAWFQTGSMVHRVCCRCYLVQSKPAGEIPVEFFTIDAPKTVPWGDFGQKSAEELAGITPDMLGDMTGGNREQVLAYGRCGRCGGPRHRWTQACSGTDG